jgi:hypothetical protein
MGGKLRAGTPPLMRAAPSESARLAPFFDGVDGVPAVILVVLKATANQDLRSDAWRQKGMRRANLRGGQRSPGIGKADAPAAALASTYPHDPTCDDDLPRAHG